MWGALKAAKETAKEEALAREASQASPAPTAAPGIEARQQRFLATVASKRAELDALDPAAREERYAELKKKELGE